MPREVVQQCLVRDANEAVERVNARCGNGDDEMSFRCECGDPSCRASVAVTRAEYKAVRDYGSRFLVRLNHENPENAWVLSENARFAVIDVVGGAARYDVLALNPRHRWFDAQDRRT
jgi:hypothetical protein